MKMSCFLSIWAFAYICLLSGAASFPLGVQNDMIHTYKDSMDTGSFKCLDGSQTIPFSKVNDDYCDCDDGSDEPGTGACSSAQRAGGKKPVPNWLFKCTSNDFVSEEVHHSKVNDGICDCCDGSDEPAGLVTCVNVCRDRGSKNLQLEEQSQKVRAQALVLRNSMKEEAVRRREEMQEKLPQFLTDLKDYEATRVLLNEKLLALAEEEFAEKKRLDDIRELWLEKYSPSLSECVMWRQTSDCSPTGERQSHLDRLCSEKIPSSNSGFCECMAEESIEEREENDSPEEDGSPSEDINTIVSFLKSTTVLYNFSCDHEELTCEYVCATGGKSGVAENVFEPPSGTAYSLPEADKVRASLREVTEKIDTLNSTIKEYEETLNRPLGTEDILRTLSGKSFSLDHQMYTYELVLFGCAYQHDKGSRGGLSLGAFSRFGASTYSDWAKDAHDLSQMYHTGGHRCWSGVARELEVHIVCGAENRLTRVEEPSMCKYRMVFESPAICEE